MENPFKNFHPQKGERLLPEPRPTIMMSKELWLKYRDTLFAQCDSCFHWWGKEDIKTCPCHFSYPERVVTKHGIEIRTARYQYCPDCAYLHTHEGGWC